ncbi:growth-regulating factor 1 isoform X1 [Coffea arabica]|uniref:Growth-regulating factor n=1 Tax=Coffea arabica TaxID=13443 RepID=A0A6P6TDT8_COFAR|nr:growth-regulating factor 1-like isoform X1 [Coffea arabica]
MDFGMITTEGVGGDASCNGAGSEPFGISLEKRGGSGVLKTERSGSIQESLRVSKSARAGEFCIFSQGQIPALLRSGSGLPGNNGQTMISFSSQSQIPYFSDEDASKTSAFPFFIAPPDPLCPRTSGYATEKSTEGMRGPFAKFRGPFTPSQWMELEHQALIYKYIIANVPVPSHLLIPLRKSFNPCAFSSLSSGSYGSSSLGWGSFHLGFAGSTDPEPGRCRRTDGKKWRCSRDAVPDQKYCERHINRGRHRSRKPVEGQNGHAVSGSTASKVAPIASSSSASVMSSSSASNSLGAVQHSFKNLHTRADNASTEHLVSRMQDLHGLSAAGDSINLKSKDSPFSIQKQHAIFRGSSQTEFGVVSPDSLLNPSQRCSRMSSKTSDSLLGFNDHETQNQHLLRHFIDKCPKDQSHRASISWPEELKSDWTQLSMSIPMSTSDFSSSSRSPRQDKPTLSPLRLAREIDPIQMGLSVTKDVVGQNQKQANWLPASWGNSILGGPLGEVLNSTSSNVGAFKSSSTLNLMTDVWDNSLQMGCSPTGVLQKSTFVSLSNSSSGSSPRTDNKKAPEGATLCDDILGSTLAHSTSIPSM